nr:hypothetical protein [Tanacetum cinerariifolium]
MEHEFQTGDDIINYVDSDQKDGELLDPSTFLASNEFPSDSEQVEENIDIAEEKEEVPMKDVEMDENHNIDHLGTEEALQWSLAKDPFLVIMEPNDQSSFLLHTILSFICNEVRGLLELFYAVKWLMKYNKLWHNYNGYGVMFHMILYRKCTRSGARILLKLQGSISNRSSRMIYKIKKSPVMVDVARGSRIGAWLRA